MFEGKALKGWSRRQEGNLCALLETIGGPADQQLGNDALSASDDTYDRGMDIVRGRRDPEPNGERAALARFERRGGAPPKR